MRRAGTDGWWVGILGCMMLAACRPDTSAPDPSDAGTSATGFTVAAQMAARKELPLADEQDAEDARRGLVLRDPDLKIYDADGKRIWDDRAYGFLSEPAPDTVNPSLWRQAQLNREHGLFQVAPSVFQVRGYDLANLTLIRGREGFIVVDPLTSEETAAAALALARRHFGTVDITAVIFTHSHIDHFGGILGLLPEDEDRRRAVKIIAPKGFLEEATSENVLAGIAMGRRASFMYGSQLSRDPRGHVDSGLGKAPALGKIGIVDPTDIVDHTPQEMIIDGVRFLFQYVPDSEAPAELAFYLPAIKAYCGAEIVSHTLHNLYTLRGAKVRDALKWSGYIDEAIDLFPETEVVFASHHWPVWGNARVIQFLKGQRDTYKYLHDQTLRLANAGYTPREIAEELKLPASLSQSFANRGYYGTVRHNVKAIYQAYFGWFDGNPANLDPLPPVSEAVKYVAAMGGDAAVLAKGQAAFDTGDYRWAATLLNHLVFAQPDHHAARELLARVYEQLGYQAESAPWRDFYLTGAQELRGSGGSTTLRLSASGELLRRLPLPRFFDSLAARVIGPKAVGKNMKINFVFTDSGESFVLTLENAVLHSKRRAADPKADVTVRITRDLLIRLLTKEVGLTKILLSDDLKIEGSRTTLLSFFSLLDQPDGRFAIVTP